MAGSAMRIGSGELVRFDVLRQCEPAGTRGHYPRRLVQAEIVG
ncbi:MAG TPA: hypothetical protein PK156_29305 [Polyangium sp.]|nr:hypothetical protein [Polyangium sp.]